MDVYSPLTYGRKCVLHKLLDDDDDDADADGKS